MRKSIGIWAITLVIAGLLITSASSVSISDDLETGVSVVKIDQKPLELSIETVQYAEMSYMPMRLDGVGIIEDPGDQLHPAIGDIGSAQLLAYRDDDVENIIWGFSADGGESYDPGVYYDIGGDYPDVNYWKDSGFCGTFVTDYQDCTGGATYHFEASDATDTETYDLSYWDWSSYGWYDMRDCASATGTVTDAEWAWGNNAFIMSTTYGDGVDNGPFIQYQTDDAGQGTISWFYLDGCAHIDADFDEMTEYTYSVCDVEDSVNSTWYLFLRCDNAANWDDESDPVGGYSLTSEGPLEYPTIDAYNDDVLIVAESNGNLVCFYSNMGPSNFMTSTIGAGAHPDIEHIEDDTYAVVYVDGGNVYKVLTEDAGATWGTPEMIAGDVVGEYKTVRMTDGADFAMYESDQADIDIYRVDVVVVPQPILGIKDIAGGFGKVTATVENTGTADASGVAWDITVEGGLVFGGTNSGTIATLAMGGEESINSKFIFGIGAITVTLSADDGAGHSASEDAAGTVIIIFVNI